MKKIVILGAGQYHLPLIEESKKMGLFTIVVGKAGNYPGIPLADDFRPVDFTDVDAIVEIAGEEGVCGITSVCTDAAVPAIAAACEAYGMVGPSRETAALTNDKYLMKRRFADWGVRTAPFTSVQLSDGEEGILRAMKALGLSYPVILKAVDNSGSRGVVKISSEEDIRPAYELVRANTRHDYCVLEDFIQGEDMGAEVFVQHGEITLLLPNGKYTLDGAIKVPIGHFAPYEMPAELTADLKEQVSLAVKSIGLENGAGNLDLIVADGKVWVVEIAARCGGNGIGEMVSACYGYNYYDKIIEEALGEEPDMKPVCSKVCATEVIRPEKTGILKSQRIEGELPPQITDVHFDFQDGTRVHTFENGSHRMGHVIAVADTLSEAEWALAEAKKHIAIDIEEEA